MRNIILNRLKGFLLLAFVLPLFFGINLMAQPVKSTVETSNQPWRYGIRAGANYDIATLQQGGEYKFGWKAGFVAEKRLVYNMYFQPSLSFQNKGYKYERTFNDKGNVNAYLIEGVAGILMKFGDERIGRGLIISVAPYFTYGIGGKSSFEDLRDTSANNFYGKITENTFSDNRLKAFDLGFQLGVGYDISHRWELGGTYVFGLHRMMTYTNFRWKGFQVHLSYFF
ncbi:MAG TPA: PorT family protein [Bacteroidales bacterium]|nr:PorT family protein [Bacteroidales bacterium]